MLTPIQLDSIVVAHNHNHQYSPVWTRVRLEMAATTSNTPRELGEHEAAINQQIWLYISDRVPEFRRLTELRKKVRSVD